MSDKEPLPQPYEVVGRVTEETLSLVVSLVQESERAAVILGAAKLDAVLERLLRRVMAHHPDGRDNLFEAERPLGTFSAKIALAYRLGLIDEHIEHALQMVRRIRNSFAHSIEDAALDSSEHRGRVAEIVEAARRFPTWDQLRAAVPTAAGVNRNGVTDFVGAVVALVVSLEVATILVERPRLSQATFNMSSSVADS